MSTLHTSRTRFFMAESKVHVKQLLHCAVCVICWQETVNNHMTLRPNLMEHLPYLLVQIHRMANFSLQKKEFLIRTQRYIKLKQMFVLIRLVTLPINFPLHCNTFQNLASKVYFKVIWHIHRKI